MECNEEMTKQRLRKGEQKESYKIRKVRIGKVTKQKVMIKEVSSRP